MRKLRELPVGQYYLVNRNVHRVESCVVTTLHVGYLGEFGEFYCIAGTKPTLTQNTAADTEVREIEVIGADPANEECWKAILPEKKEE